MAYDDALKCCTGSTAVMTPPVSVVDVLKQGY